MSFKSVFTVETERELTPRQLARIARKMEHISAEDFAHALVCSCTNQRGDLPVMTYNAFPSGKISLAGSDKSSYNGATWTETPWNEPKSL